MDNMHYSGFYGYLKTFWLTGLLVAALCSYPATSHSAPGVSDSVIKIAGVMDLKGRSKGLGQGMRKGIIAALKGEKVKGRSIQYLAYDDSYTPVKTAEETNKLLKKDVFLVMGNVGTPTAKVSLPILAKHKIPAVGFFTGAGLLRPGKGDIINYRASYVQETAAVIRSALSAGVNANEICAYVQNDAYGMAGVEGVRQALKNEKGSEEVVALLQEIIDMEGTNPQRNLIGPVGVYRRNTYTSREGFESLKSWEDESGTKCKLVVSVGTYNAIARFAGYSRYKNEGWVVSAVSFTGADNFRNVLTEFNVTNNIVMTQVVPPLDSTLPIVVEARKSLGEEFGYVSLEGYIVGKMWLKIMRSIKGDITRENLLQAVRGREFDVGGLKLSFVGDNQASDLVLLTYLKDGVYRNMNRTVWKEMLDI